jgi:hypothetical protein
MNGFLPDRVHGAARMNSLWMVSSLGFPILRYGP